MSNKALIIVDLQNDFCEGGSLAVTGAKEIVPIINKLIEYTEKNQWVIMASRDWHPAVTSHFKDYGGIWPVHCVAGSVGAEFHPDLKLSDDVIIASKATKPDEDGFSAVGDNAFIDEDNFVQPLDVLEFLEVEEVYVCGLATDYCVKATVLDLIKAGYKTYLLIDAIRAVNINDYDGLNAVKEMKDAGVICTTTEDIT